MSEPDLWRQVIFQALSDATLGFTEWSDIAKNEQRTKNRIDRGMYFPSPEMDVYHRQGKAWFSLKNPDFREVCELAELNPECVYAGFVKTWETVSPMIERCIEYQKV
jgi:hypothetical protein